jgi:hypothetical protein
VVQEGEGDERVEGVGDELLLWKYEVVVLELILKKPRQRAVGARD